MLEVAGLVERQRRLLADRPRTVGNWDDRVDSYSREGQRSTGRSQVPGRPVHTFEVVRTEHITSHMIRVVLGGSGFDTFTPSEFTDSYVKLVFVADDVDVAALAAAVDAGQLRRAAGAKQPVVRTITVRRADPTAREITVDIAVHGDHGSAGPWAASATARAADISDGPERRLFARPRGRLAFAGRRRDRAAGDQCCAGSVARQRNRPGIHRSRRARGRNSAGCARRCPDQLDPTAVVGPIWSARSGPATTRRWSRRSRPPTGCPGRYTPSSTVKPRP